MKILLFIIILLLGQLIANQHELDYHMIEQTRGNLLFDISKDGIMYNGIINQLIWFMRRFIKGFIDGIKEGVK